MQEIRERYNQFIKDELPRLQRLFNYFDGKHDILFKKDRKNKKDAKLVNNYPSMITTFATGFFMGEPITYQCKAGEEEKFAALYNYLSTEEEQDRNYQIAEYMSIFGRGYELAYLDSMKELRFKAIDPRDMVVIKDSTIEENIIGAFRHSTSKEADGRFKVTVEYYDNREVAVYSWIQADKENKVLPVITAIETRPHGFDRVPVVEYLNNTWQKGDFEKVLTLIDGYNEATSTAIDDVKDFTAALLKLKNLSGTKEEDIEAMLNMGAFLVDDNGDAEWMIKNINDTYSENIKVRTEKDIHKFAMVPDLTDEKFAGNTSGIAIKFKTLGLEQIAARKEMQFKKALNERLSLIIDHLKIAIIPLEIKKIFTRNLPVNGQEEADTAVKLNGILSKKTNLSRISGIESVEDELAQIEKETSSLYSDYEDLNNEQS